MEDWGIGGFRDRYPIFNSRASQFCIIVRASPIAYCTTRELVYRTTREFTYCTTREFTYCTTRELVYCTTRELAYSTTRELAYSTTREFTYCTTRELAYSTTRELAYSTTRERGRSHYNKKNAFCKTEMLPLTRTAIFDRLTNISAIKPIFCICL